MRDKGKPQPDRTASQGAGWTGTDCIRNRPLTDLPRARMPLSVMPCIVMRPPAWQQHATCQHLRHPSRGGVIDRAMSAPTLPIRAEDQMGRFSLLSGPEKACPARSCSPRRSPPPGRRLRRRLAAGQVTDAVAPAHATARPERLVAPEGLFLTAARACSASMKIAIGAVSHDEAAVSATHAEAVHDIAHPRPLVQAIYSIRHHCEPAGPRRQGGLKPGERDMSRARLLVSRAGMVSSITQPFRALSRAAPDT